MMKMKKIIAAVSAAAMCITAAVPALAADMPAVGQSLAAGGSAETAAETQKLIDSRPDIQRPMENIDRGLVAVTVDKTVFVSWRWLGTESADTKYNLYRDGQLVNPEPMNATNYTDINPGRSYQVAPVVNGQEGEKCAAVTPWADDYIDIPIEKPEPNTVNGEEYTYSAGDASAADLDGDGQYEIVLKWDPSNAKDAAQEGFTGECILDAYETDGTRMWRINMGPNIRSGQHDTQFMVYDFDMDGKAEMACRTADGTIAGDGTVIGNEKANYAVENNGKNLTGPLFLTVFDGEDGTIIDTVDYDPQITGTTKDGVEWDITAWGDSYGNRSERYLAGIGYLDGERPSMVFCRGYYTGSEGNVGGRTVMAAYDLKDKKLVQKWRFDTMDYKNQYIGQGNHSMSLADVDYDGCDEIIYGSLAVDNDGTPMYSTGLGHGDAQHVADLDPSRPGLEVYSCHEDKGSAYGYEMRDARTGEILYGMKTETDNGRGAADDIDPNYPGAEGWSAAGVLTTSKGEVISTSYTMAANFFAWWDGDLGREVQDGIYIGKWNHDTQKTDTIFTAGGTYAVNGTKANPSLTADLLGDWREEVIYPLKDSSALRLFTTTTPTGYRIPALMHDIQYRNHVALQNVCYNQPTHTSYYLGFDTETIPVPQITVNGQKNPDLAKKSWNISDLYTGENLTLVVGCPTALIEGQPKRIDNDNTAVVPEIDENDRTLVPIRFIAEAFGAEVEWMPETQFIRITMPNNDFVSMTVGKTEYETGCKGGPVTYTDDPALSGGTKDSYAIEEYKTMDTAPVIKNDRTLVPLRAVAEALGKKVFWNDGLIVISDTEQQMSEASAAQIKADVKSAPVPDKVEIVAINGTGKKYYDNQLDVYGVTATDNDGNLEQGAVDLDINTRWSANGPNMLTVDLGSEQTVTGVSIAMWKGSERTYPFLTEYSADGETWSEALPKTQNSGETEEFEKYMFPSPVKARYIRYNGDGDTVEGKNYCHISEIAVLGE